MDEFGKAQRIEVQDVDHLGIVAGLMDDAGLVEEIDQRLGVHPQEHLGCGQAVKAMLQCWWRCTEMTKRLPAATAPGPLEDYAARFDDLFTTLAQRRAFRRYLEGLLLPAERNKTLLTPPWPTPNP